MSLYDKYLIFITISLIILAVLVRFDLVIFFISSIVLGLFLGISFLVPLLRSKKC